MTIQPGLARLLGPRGIHSLPGRIHWASSLFLVLFALAGCAAPRHSPAVITEGSAADPRRDLLVTVLPGPMPPAMLLRELATDYGIELRAEWPIAPLGIVCAVFRAAGPAEAAALMVRLAADPRVEQVQALNLFRTAAVNGPDGPTGPDPLLGLQHAADRLNLRAAHRYSTGRGVRVAVVDSGVAETHEDLSGSIGILRDFVTAPPAAVPAERHGTAMAGIIAARAENHRGILGVAPGSMLLALRACWEETPGAGGQCSSFTLARAIAFAIGARADVLSLSLSGPRDPLLARLIFAARSAGIVVVSSAGDGGEEDFPANEPGVIGVGAARHGAAALIGPSHRVLTTVPGGYDFVSGTSVAAAHVSGLAALLRERMPFADAAVVLRTLRATVAAPDGIPDACRAVAPRGAVCTPAQGMITGGLGPAQRPAR